MHEDLPPREVIRRCPPAKLPVLLRDILQTNHCQVGEKRCGALVCFPETGSALTTKGAVCEAVLPAPRFPVHGSSQAEGCLPNCGDVSDFPGVSQISVPVYCSESATCDVDSLALAKGKDFAQRQEIVQKLEGDFVACKECPLRADRNRRLRILDA